jgi:hypothetical protein
VARPEHLALGARSCALYHMKVLCIHRERSSNIK